MRVKVVALRPERQAGRSYQKTSAVCNLELIIIDLNPFTIKQKVLNDTFPSVWFYVTHKSFCYNKYLSAIYFTYINLYLS